MDYANMKPIKKGEQTHIQRKFSLWHRYWMNCKDPEKKKRIFDQLVKLGWFMEGEMLKRKKPKEDR